jgi:hypothetical protein
MAKRFTNDARKKLVKSVMADVPMIDYQEKFRVLLQTWAISNLPDEMRGSYAKYPEWFSHTYTEAGTDFTQVCIVGPDSDNWKATLAAIKGDARLWAQIAELERLNREQEDRIDALKDKVRALVWSCFTVEQLHARAPELTKYVETDEPLDRTVPEVTSVLESLAEAGWPK